MKRTPLYEEHLKLKAKMVEFAGFEMPIQYHSIQQEHRATREKAGLFDVSHMGEIQIGGEGSLAFLQSVFTNDFTTLKPGSIRYTLLLDQQGLVLDDCLVYCRSLSDYLVVVNASNQDKDYAWLASQNHENVILKNISNEVAQIALQGPQSQAILETLTQHLPIRYYTFLENVEILGYSYLISRTGYTGEFGYEVYGSAQAIVALWRKLIELGCEPVGLGARDTLRLEAGMPLYGHEFTDRIHPLAIGVNFAIKMDKPNFNGKERLKEKVNQQRIGLSSSQRVIARETDEVYQDGKKVGYVTSGTFSPSLQVSIAMAMVDLGVDLDRAFEIKGRRSGEFSNHQLPFIKK